ncbi:MAG: amidase family protein [Parvularculaceae bacterium]
MTGTRADRARAQARASPPRSLRAVGTETNGSIICPSNVNGIVGFKPTVGLVSQQYIVPISATQDTAGPMTKSVKGAAMMLSAMATGEAKTDYAAALDAQSLKGTRVGVARFAQGNNPATIARFDAALHELEAAGAILVELTPPDIDERALRDAELLVMSHEFKAGMDAYLSDAAPAAEVRSLDALISFNREHADVEMTLFGQDRAEDAAAAGGLDDPAYLNARETALRLMRAEGIDKLLADNDVKVIVAPSGTPSPRIDQVNGDVWPEWVGLDYMAAIAGYPHLTVPMGTINAAPIGLSFIASANEDVAVLSYGYAFEQQSKLRAEPHYLKNAEAVPEIAVALKRKGELLAE